MSERLVKRVVEPNEQANAWAQAQVIGSLAASHDDGYLAHINTPNTATDMLSIARAHGRDKIQYWGFSYVSLTCLSSVETHENGTLAATGRSWAQHLPRCIP